MPDARTQAMSMDVLLPRLRNVRRTGDGWMACCPAHEDKRPSLSIKEGEDVPIVLKCFAGCSFEAISGALGFAPRDNRASVVVATYSYCDEEGILLYEKLRYIPKDFRFQRPDTSSVTGRSMGIKGIRRVLYRLQDIWAAIQNDEPVLIAEGEKDADALAKHGFCATSNDGGACAKQVSLERAYVRDPSKWLPEYSESLRGADAVIVPDNDEPGRLHAQVIASALFGIAKSVKIIALPIPLPGKDAHDFFAAGGTREQLSEIIEKTPVLSEAGVVDVIEPRRIELILRDRRFDPNYTPQLIPPVYLCGGVAISTRQNLTAITAAPKVGKSAIVGGMIAAAMAMAGSDTLGFTSSNPDGGAIIHLDTEQSKDDHATNIRRAIQRAGREVCPDWLVSHYVAGFTVAEIQEALLFELERQAKAFHLVHSVFIDGIADTVNDVNDPAESNEWVNRLHGLAIQYHCPIVTVIHLNPGSETKSRGHLGSQLERKAETNLRLEKNGEITSVWSDKQRREPILKGEGPRFRWSNELAMHVCVDVGPSANEKEIAEDAINLRDDVFGGRPSMRHCELEEITAKLMKRSSRTARREIKKWGQLGIIERSVGGLIVPKG